ncbi:hypothetical protein D3C79_813410 [compost metagenome]
MLGAVVASDQIGILELITAFATGILEANGEGRQILDTDFAQEADEQARINPTGEQHADIHRGSLADRHGLAGALQDPVTPVFQAQVVFIGARPVMQLPPDLLFNPALSIDTHPGGRRQLLDIGQQRTRCGHHSVKIQVVVECHRVEHRVDVATLQQSRQA